MAKTRLLLQNKLKELTGLTNCYFSPPNGFDLVYPCIVYTWNNNYTEKADNINYIKARRYTVTIITGDQDTDLSDKLVEGLMYCSLVRHFVNDNLEHFVHDVFY